jgi:hypothetical protein
MTLKKDPRQIQDPPIEVPGEHGKKFLNEGPLDLKGPMNIGQKSESLEGRF